MSRIGTRAEVWLGNLVAGFARYVADRVLPQSVPEIVRQHAVRDSARFAMAHMRQAYPFHDRYAGLSMAIAEARRRYPNRGTVLEFGVYKAGMINVQARRFPDLRFVGFDSFEGLGETWEGMAPKGTFDLGARLPRVRGNVSLVKGWFAQTVPGWLEANPIAPAPLLVHVDCDTYGATVDALEACARYLPDGLLMQFDDFFGFPNWRNAGYRALQEWAERHGATIAYLAYGTKEATIIASLPPGPGRA